MHSIALALALFPIISGCLAFGVALILATIRVRIAESAEYSPDATDGEQWCEALIVDLEWLDMAQAAVEYEEASTAYRAVTLLSVQALTRTTARPGTATANAERAIVMAQARIVARVHETQRTTASGVSHVPGRKLISEAHAACEALQLVFGFLEKNTAA